MRLLLGTLLLPVLLTGAFDGTCPAYRPGHISCDIIFFVVMDVTNLMPAARVDDEFQFVRSQIIPIINYNGYNGSEYSMVYQYGASPPIFQDQLHYPDMCSRVNDLNNDALQNGGKVTTLNSIVQWILDEYPFRVDLGIAIQMVIFSNTQNQSDIAATAQTLRSFENNPKDITVLSLSGNTDIWNTQSDIFKNIIPMYSTFGSMDQTTQAALAKCLLCLSCITDQCPMCAQFTSPPTPLTSTTPIPTTSQPSSPDSSDGPSCSCNLQSLWIDVIVLIDNSAATGKEGTYDLLNYVQETFLNVNIMKNTSSQQMFTMMGIVVYSNVATVLYPLGSLDSDSLQNIPELPYSSQNETYLDSAISIARQQFDLYGRPNTRKLIMIVAEDYYSGKYPDPQSQASEFKMAGVIAVYDYLDKHHSPSSVLMNVASPGYYSKSTDSPAFDMPQALCNANCFCPTDFSPYKTNAPSGYPTAGCYSYYEIPLNVKQANLKCQRLGSGYTAMEKNIGKAQFLSNLTSTDRYWTGFTWDNIFGAWTWNDGKLVNGTYQPWLVSSAHTSGIDCAFVQQVQGVDKWSQVDCKSGYSFVCERPACDCAHYCE